eukprot:3058042-Rhodomonas_salina.1
MNKYGWNLRNLRNASMRCGKSEWLCLVQERDDQVFKNLDAALEYEKGKCLVELRDLVPNRTTFAHMCGHGFVEETIASHVCSSVLTHEKTLEISFKNLQYCRRMKRAASSRFVLF